jgi:5-formyltetrahydrofolate cyclo-ligase
VDDAVALRAAKAARRRAVRATRQAMAPEERAARSAAIVEHVRGVPAWREARLALAFHPFGSEPDVTPLLSGPLPEVLLPRVEGRELAFVRWSPGDPLVPSSFGVPEPVGPRVDPAGASVAVVPGLSFDADGHRLGYGAGFYDRALAGVAGRVLTIGVCFATEIVDVVPYGPADVTVDVVVTDEGLATP